MFRRTRAGAGLRITGMEIKETTRCPRCVEALNKTENYIREHPDESALVCMGAGFLLAQFPLRLLAATVARLAVMLLKPTVLLYAFFRMAEDIYARRAPVAAPDEEVSP